MDTRPNLHARNRRTLWWLGGLTVAMFGFGFAMIPLYGVLCRVTGAPSIALGTAQVDADRPGAEAPVLRWVTVKFDTTVHPDLPWAFAPEQREVRVHPGEARMVKFTATNRASRAITGQAIASIAPWQATVFFHKMECFCFSRQTLSGSETREMPLRFVVSPDLPRDIHSLTLSYSFLKI